mgnify:CR=1 FL=1
MKIGLDSYEVIKDADCLFICTEGDEFKDINFKKLSKFMKRKIILDARNILIADEAHKNNFEYFDYKFENKKTHTNIWNMNQKLGSVGKKFMVHPAIFPVPYIQRMIEIFTKEGEVILDPFLGSGTTLIAAEKSGRYCYGFELNKEGYWPLIQHRLDEFIIDKEKINLNT